MRKKKNIEIINYNQSTKLLPEKTSNCHMFIFPHTIWGLNARGTLIFQRSSCNEASGRR